MAFSTGCPGLVRTPRWHKWWPLPLWVSGQSFRAFPGCWLQPAWRGPYKLWPCVFGTAIEHGCDAQNPTNKWRRRIQAWNQLLWHEHNLAQWLEAKVRLLDVNCIVQDLNAILHLAICTKCRILSNTHVCAVPATNLRIRLIQSLRVTKRTPKGLIQVFSRWYTMVSLDFSKGVDCVDSDLLGEHCGGDGVSLHLIWLPDSGLCWL